MRKKVKILTFVMLLFGLTNQTQASNIRADVDQLNGINTTDALLVLRKSLGLDMSATNWRDSNTTADVNCDKISDLTDVRLILRKSLDLDMNKTGWCVEDSLDVVNWKMFMIAPNCTMNDAGDGVGKSHSRYMINFKLLIDALAEKGINTIWMDMAYDKYHYTSTTQLNDHGYSPERGFTFDEAQEMARYIRSKNMKIVVGFELLTGQQATVLSKAHPEFMLPELPWVFGEVIQGGSYRIHNGLIYNARGNHIATADNEPRGSGEWTKTWVRRFAHLRDPFNTTGEQVVFGMIDELINAFTVEGKKPEGFHLHGDEGRFFNDVIKCPTNCGGLTAAQSFALPFNNAYTHLQATSPGIKVIMWNDMLQEDWNGGEYGTAGAIDLINKNIIIATWYYNKVPVTGYNYETKQYEGISTFTNKGFTVLPASWQEPDSTADLIWTENRLRQEGKNVLGHLYSTWTKWTERDVVAVFNDPNATVNSEYNRGLANSLTTTISDINIKSCRQTLTSCGIYPNCTSPVEMSGLYNGDYREYTCDAGTVNYTVKAVPTGISYWNFDGNTRDSFGSNHGTLEGGAKLSSDSIRGEVLKLNGDGYFTAPDNDTLDMTSTMSVSLWFKLAEIPPENTRNALLTKGIAEYQFLIADDGEIYAYTSNGQGSTEIGIRQEVLNTEWSLKWTHFVYTLDGINEKIYINGKLVKTSNPLNSIKSFAGTKAGDHNLNIGGRDTGHFYFDGLIDDAMIYDTALDGSDIRAIYYNQKR